MWRSTGALMFAVAMGGVSGCVAAPACPGSDSQAASGHFGESTTDWDDGRLEAWLAEDRSDLPHAISRALAQGATDSDPRQRGRAALVLAYSSDDGAVRALEELLRDRVERVRVLAASSLVFGFQRPEGLLALVTALDSDDRWVRVEAIKALQIETRERFGYAPDASPEARRGAVASWRQWYSERYEGR